MRKFKVKFYLKSGNTFTVRCKEANVYSEGGVLTGWSLSGVHKRLNATVGSVEAVTVKERWFVL